MSNVSPELEVATTEPVVEEVVATEPAVEEVAEVVTDGKKAKKCKKAKKEKACKKEKKAKKEKPCKKENPCKKEKKVKECKCKKDKPFNYSVFSLILTLVTIAMVFALPTYVIGSGNKLVEGVSILDGALGVLKLNDVSIINSGVVALVYSATLLTVPVALVLSVGLTFVSFVSKKNAKYYVRANAIINLVVFFFVAMISMCSYRYLTNKENAIEFASLLVAGVNGLAYIAINAKDYKKDSFLPTVLCGLSFANVLYCLYATVYMNKKLTISIMGRSTLHAAMYLGIVAFVSFIFFYSLVAMSKKKSSTIDLLVYFVNVIFSVGVIFFGFYVIDKMRPYALDFIASLVISVIQFVVCIISINYGKLLTKTQEQAPVVAVEETPVVAEEVPVEEVVEETPVVMEEVADVDGVVAEPVEEVLVAETVTEDVAIDELPEASYVEEPVFESEPKLNFASSYMKAKEATPTAVAFDWFLESLTSEEKAEFTELFVYKYLGGTAILPDYVPGGNNYEFFRAFFVNLGKYRNRISDTLIEKMYQFMVKKY